MKLRIKHLKLLVTAFLVISLLLAGCKPVGSTITPNTITTTVTNTIISIITTTTTTSPPTSETSTTSSITFPPGTDLKFEIIKIGGLYKDENNVPTKICVFSNKQYPLPFVFASWYPDSVIILNNLDFSEYFVIMLFMGTRTITGPFIKPERIWQNENTIYVLADFNNGGLYHLDAYSAPCQSVKVSKTTMTQFGELTFILLDLSGAERARAVDDVLK